MHKICICRRNTSIRKSRMFRRHNWKKKVEVLKLSMVGTIVWGSSKLEVRKIKLKLSDGRGEVEVSLLFTYVLQRVGLLLYICYCVKLFYFLSLVFKVCFQAIKYYLRSNWFQIFMKRWDWKKKKLNEKYDKYGWRIISFGEVFSSSSMILFLYFI